MLSIARFFCLFVSATLVNRVGGGGGYKIRNADGAEVVKKAQSKTLGHILAHFDIMPDNPMVLMTQNMSRDFLQGNDDRDKFRLFMRATLLETMYEEVKSAELNSATMLSRTKAQVR